MKLSEFLFKIKYMVPNMSSIGMTDDQLATLITQGCDNVNMLAKIYFGYTDINVIANQASYSVSTVAPTYLGADKRGIYFKDSNNQWQKIYPKTISWLAQRFRDYLNAASSALPEYYAIDNDDLLFYPPPASTASAAARIYHLKKAGALTNNDHYPFTGTAVELTSLLPADDAIIAYVRWKLAPAFGQVSDLDLREREYLNEVRKARAQIRRRPDAVKDIFNHPDFN